MEKMVYVDESGIDTFISREYGRSHRGNIILGERSGKRFARESFIAGYKSKKHIAPFCYQGTMNTGLFNFWLVNFLVPSLLPDDIIIMDNAAFHKSEETKKIIADAKCKLIFLPPYSPDLNPIEQFWANLKAKIKKTVSRYSTLQEAIDNALK